MDRHPVCDMQIRSDMVSNALLLQLAVFLLMETK